MPKVPASIAAVNLDFFDILSVRCLPQNEQIVSFALFFPPQYMQYTTCSSGLLTGSTVVSALSLLNAAVFSATTSVCTTSFFSVSSSPIFAPHAGQNFASSFILIPHCEQNIIFLQYH